MINILVHYSESRRLREDWGWDAGSFSRNSLHEMMCSGEQACSGLVGRKTGSQGKWKTQCLFYSWPEALVLDFCKEEVNRQKWKVTFCWSRCFSHSGHRWGVGRGHWQNLPCPWKLPRWSLSMWVEQMGQKQSATFQWLIGWRHLPETLRTDWSS